MAVEWMTLLGDRDRCCGLVCVGVGDGSCLTSIFGLPVGFGAGGFLTSGACCLVTGACCAGWWCFGWCDRGKELASDVARHV